MRGRKASVPPPAGPQILTASRTTALAHTKAGIRRLALTDTYTLGKSILGYPDLSPGFHGPLCRHIDVSPYQKNLYLCSRLHFKTSVVTVARNVRRILRDPQMRILIASNKEDNAAAMLGEIQQKLKTPELVWAFPDVLWDDPEHKAEKWTKTALTVKRKPRREATVEAIGLSGEITSKHYDHITLDDLVGKENSETRDQLLGTIDWFRKSLALGEPHCTWDIVGTPWHSSDLYGHLLEQKFKHGMRLGLYRRACWENEHGEVPGTPDETTAPTFPEKFSMEYLLDLKKQMGTEVFAAQMLLNPEEDETAVFSRAKIRPYIVPRAQVPPIEDLWIAMTVDPAISTKAWADYTAIAVGGFDQHNVLWILDLLRGRWPEDRTVKEIFNAWARTPGIRAIGFEAVGFAQIYRRLLVQEGERRQQQLPIMKLERDSPMKKNQRIRALQPPWESGDIRIADDVPALDEFLDEAARFRTYKESAHDDMLDAVVDLYQLRIRPSAKRPDWLTGDDELDARRQFETDLLLKTPDLDRASLRNAYDLHRHFAQKTQRQETRVLDADVGEFYMVS